jgi:hypothetical protein
MRTRRPRSPRFGRPSLHDRHRSIAAAGAIALALLARPAAGQPTPGFVEDWPGTSTQNWISAQMTTVNPGTGGVGGSGDGFLQMSRSMNGNFGVRSTEAEYTGDWIAAGIKHLRLWLNDVGDDQNFEVHVSLGQFVNLWQYDPAFLPPSNAWSEFVVNLNDSASFSQIIGSGAGSYTLGLRDVQVLHVRHDNPPFAQVPDANSGELGLDRIMLSSVVIGVTPEGPRGPAPVSLAPPRPNPSRGPVAITASSSAGDVIRLTIVDAAGRVVRRAELAGSGPRIWVWDGLDEQGREVAAGAYRVRAVGSGGGLSRALIRVR